MTISRFHLAFPVIELESTKKFYTEVLGCKLGRQSNKWIDFNLFGHQIVAHFSPDDCRKTNTNMVDGDTVASSHFGVILSGEKWLALCEKIKKQKVRFMIDPKIRFKNQNGEQGTFFIQDPSNNVLEFKSFKDDSKVFKK